MISGINITPMVDVMLVLLVILMVSSTYIVQQSLKVNLPTSASSDGGVSNTGIVAISPDGALQFNNQPVDEEALVRHLAELRGSGGAEVTLVISADQEAQHGRVVHVMDLARQQQIAQFAVQVTRVATR